MEVLDTVLRRCAALTGRGVLLRGLLLALATEAVTVLQRFGLGLEATRDTGALAAFTLGLRIHHGYLGVVAALVAWAWLRPRPGAEERPPRPRRRPGPLRPRPPFPGALARHRLPRFDLVYPDLAR